jgi:4-alpha-glucanotransferase
MTLPRASGVLLHPTSLPGEFGIGDLGSKAYEFVDLLTEAKQTYWQVLPLGPTGYGDSPYSCFSALAGNTLLISPEKLVERELLTSEQITDRPEFSDTRVNFGGVYEWKNRILPLAFEAFQTSTRVDLSSEFETFCGENEWWLDDFAAYRAIKLSQDQKPWYEWPEPLKLREEGALAAITDQLASDIRAQKFYQFLFFSQWFELKKYANDNGVKIIGDMPLFIALDSSDVWCNQSKFKLDKDGSPKVVSGVPPDYFSSTGQLWGNPIYDWEAMKEDGFRWWITRVSWALSSMDIIRVDHFRGFAALWEVPGGDPTAEHGSWVDALGRDLFSALKKSLGDLPLIAEDLGVITPDVESLRDDFGIPGMKILQYAFSGDAKNDYLPHNYPNNCAVYTGTHDNDTTVGWWDSAKPHERDLCLKYLNTDGAEIHWDMMRAAWASVADTAITPMQDILGLGNNSRMNLPASLSGNWYWRYPEGAVTPEIVARLKDMTEVYGRTG